MADPKMILAAEKTRREFDDLLRASHPTDVVALDESAVEMLSTLWVCSNKDNGHVPADIFFTDNIPLPDFMVDLTSFALDGEATWFRVCTFGGYKNAPKHHQGMSLVGMCIVTFSHRLRPIDVVFPMWVAPGENFMRVGFMYIPGIDDKLQKQLFGYPDSFPDLSGAVSYCLSIWYGIQIALLHPTVQYVFKDPALVDAKNYAKHKQHRYKRKKTRYIKRYYITGDDINDKIYIASGKHRFVRKTMKWWVIGHWRHYKNGKVIFIKGYWKGPLRNTQIPIEPREREIVTDGISIDNSTESVHN